MIISKERFQGIVEHAVDDVTRQCYLGGEKVTNEQYLQALREHDPVFADKYATLIDAFDGLRKYISTRSDKVLN